MEMPTPSDEHRRLERLVGTWKGDETIHPSAWDPKGFTATGTMAFRSILDGFFVVDDYEERRGDRVTYRGHGVYGWDPRARRYTMYWFDSMGGNPEVVHGEWTGDELTFVRQGPPSFTRFRYRFDGTDAMRFDMSSSTDGAEWKLLMEGAYRREK